MAAGTALAVGGAVASLAGGLSAQESSRKGQKAMMAQLEENKRLWGGLRVPTIEEQQIILQNPNLMGQYTPEQVQAMELTTSMMENVKASPETIDAQQSALEGISEVAEGGYSESDKATAREIQRTVSQDSRARQQSILNAMAQRGTLGSGMELAAQLQGGQQAAEQMSRGGEGLTQQAQSRALQALSQQGTLASGMRTQEFGEQSDVARAQDAINEFNVRNRQNIAQTNVSERNRAQLANLQQKQDLENMRASLTNQQQMHNKGLAQTRFQNQATKLAGMTGANTAIGSAAQDKYNTQAAATQGLASGVGGIFAGIAGSQMADDAARKQREHELLLAETRYGKK